MKYPAPNYAAFSKNKDRPGYTAAGKEMCNLGRSHWARNDMNKAEAYYSRAIEACPANPEFLFEQAQLVWSQGKLDEARQLLAKALDIKPDFISARVSYFRICMLQNDYQTPRDNWGDILRYRDRDNCFMGVQRAPNERLLRRS